MNLDKENLKRKAREVLGVVREKAYKYKTKYCENNTEKIRMTVENQWKYFDRQEQITEKLFTKILLLEEKIERLEEEISNLKKGK